MGHLTPEQIETYRAALRTERTRILSNIDTLQEELGSSLTAESGEHGWETHMGDLATVTFLREMDLTIEENEEHLLNDIDAALQRIEDGTYGVCTVSGEDIPTDRLDALPWAARCIEHEQALGH